MHSNNLELIVTGTGRCGTAYLAQLLTNAGIPCGHECIFNQYNLKSALNRLEHSSERKLSYCSTHAISDNDKELPFWVDPRLTIAESSYLIVPYLNLEELKDIPLIHIVRNPLKVVSSFIGDLNYFNDEINFSKIKKNLWQRKIYEFLPELAEIKTQIERVCYFYVRWNEFIEDQKNKRPYEFFKVERISDQDKFFEFIKKEKTILLDNKKVNTFGKRNKDFSVSDIPSGNVKDKFVAKMFQYNYGKNFL